MDDKKGKEGKAVERKDGIKRMDGRGEIREKVNKDRRFSPDVLQMGPHFLHRARDRENLQRLSDGILCCPSRSIVPTPEHVPLENGAAVTRVHDVLSRMTRSKRILLIQILFLSL